jgi:tetratricopeptide (TPR) repeat protein
MTAFLVSSQFSSFSFRSAQNGMAFFMVMAVAVREISKALPRVGSKVSASTNLRPVIAAGWLSILLMTTFCMTKVFAQYHLYRAERSPDYNDAVGHFGGALAADPEYAGAYLSYSARAVKDDPGIAARLTRNAIEHGLGLSFVYSQLAKRQLADGDGAAAEATFREAISIYPRSLFLRTEFIVFLEDRGRSSEAAEHAAIARAVDPRHAIGWYLMVREGNVAAFYRAQKDKNVAPPAELTPSNGVRQYLDQIPVSVPAEPK